MMIAHLRSSPSPEPAASSSSRPLPARPDSNAQDTLAARGDTPPGGVGQAQLPPPAALQPAAKQGVKLADTHTTPPEMPVTVAEAHPATARLRIGDKVPELMVDAWLQGS